MTTTSTNPNEEAAIRAVIDTWASAMRAKDADGVVSQYAVDNVKFILAPPLRYTKDHPFDRKAFRNGFPPSKGRSITKIATSRSRPATTSVSATA